MQRSVLARALQSVSSRTTMVRLTEEKKMLKRLSAFAIVAVLTFAQWQMRQRVVFYEN